MCNKGTSQMRRHQKSVNKLKLQTHKESSLTGYLPGNSFKRERKVYFYLYLILYIFLQSIYHFIVLRKYILNNKHSVLETFRCEFNVSQNIRLFEQRIHIFAGVRSVAIVGFLLGNKMNLSLRIFFVIYLSVKYDVSCMFYRELFLLLLFPVYFVVNRNFTIWN